MEASRDRFRRGIYNCNLIGVNEKEQCEFLFDLLSKGNIGDRQRKEYFA